MIKGFENLTTEEFAILRDALPKIAVLIGGADGTFDAREKRWAEKIANIYTYSKEDHLADFFKKAADHFLDKAESIMRQHPDTQARNEHLADKLAQLNHVFPKLNPEDAYQLYKSFRHFAKEIAKASGGILGIGGISPEEYQWIDLPMIQPVEKPTPEDED